MAKVHITLVGSQPIPAYKGIVNDRPEKVVLVCSKGTEKVAKRVEDLVKKKIEPQPAFAQEEITPVDPREIREIVVDMAGKHISEGDEVTVNITGGTKPWSILFYDYFKERKQTSCYYIGQNNLLYNLGDDAPREVNVPLGIEDTLLLHGINILESHEIDEYEEADFTAVDKIQKMRRCNMRSFGKLAMILSEGQNPAQIGMEYLEYLENENRIICELWDYRARRMKTFETGAPHMKRLIMNAGWFELMVARLLHEWRMDAPLLHSCKVNFVSDNTAEEKNEIDLLMMVDGKLLFVECKTRVSKPTDINKFREVVRHSGGMAAKHIFFTYDTMDAKVAPVCDNADIPYYCMRDIIKGGEASKKELRNKIEDYLKEVNAR